MTRQLVIIPTYNEIENIRAITAAVLELSDPSFDILVVDDGSPDGTGAEAVSYTHLTLPTILLV